MVEITTDLIKEMRIRTGAGILYCKKALIESKGDIELAIENLRKFDAIFSLKKTSNFTNEGVVLTKVRNEYGYILEVNCQTDFVSKNIIFQNFSKKILEEAITNNITNIAILQEKFEKERVSLINKIGENIRIRRISFLRGNKVATYQHSTRIGVLVSVNMNKNNKQFLKTLAMHIAASKPEFIRKKDIPAELIEKEYQIQMDIAAKSGKTREIIKKIVEGRMEQFFCEKSLYDQKFIMESTKTITQILKENDADIINFIRFEIGEDIKEKISG